MTRYSTTKHRVETPSAVIKKKRITHALIPKVRNKLAKKQDYKCPICERDLRKLINTLDHCHSTGYMRGTLCNNCNGLEGKLTTLLMRMDIGKIGFEKLLQNLANHRHPSNLKKKWIHPNAETLREQRDRQNARARLLYKKKKELKCGKVPRKRKRKAK